MDEIITEKEWHNRMMLKKIYDVIFIDWKSARTRVMDKYSGDIFDVTTEDIGRHIMLRLKKLD